MNKLLATGLMLGLLTTGCGTHHTHTTVVHHVPVPVHHVVVHHVPVHHVTVHHVVVHHVVTRRHAGH